MGEENETVVGCTAGLFIRVCCRKYTQVVTRYPPLQNEHVGVRCIESMQAVTGTPDVAVLFTTFDVCILKPSMAIQRIGVMPYLQTRTVTMTSYAGRVILLPHFQQYYCDIEKKKLRMSSNYVCQHKITSCCFTHDRAYLGCAYGEVFIIPL